MAYGKIKADTFVYDNSGSDVEVTLSSLGNKANLASPTFTGTVTIPTPAANDNTTKAASTAYVQTELGDYAALHSPTFTGLATFNNLTVNGTTTTINSTTLNVDDKNIELGKVGTPTDTTADGGGITLKGATDKTITWSNANDRWEFNQHIKTTGSLYVESAGTFLKSNQLGFYPTGTAYIDHSVTGQSLSVRVSNSSSNDTTALTIASTGAATFSNSVSDSKGDVRKIPRLDKSSAHTLVASDAGKTITISTGGITVPNSVMSEGDAVTIVNMSGSDQTITQGSGVTLHNSADASTGNRTLAGRGIATIWFSNAGVGYISGAGLS